MIVTFRGRSTRTLYRFDPSLSLPAVLIDSAGNPVAQGTWNGETVVLANRDGSVQRSYAGGPTPGDPYSPTVIPSPWESL